MEEQTLFDGVEQRDRGIAQAVSHADRESPNWSDKAYDFLLDFLRTNTKFMAEDVRNASVGIVPAPPSNRAWGAVIVRAAKKGIIRKVGFNKVKNPKAHCTPATEWESLYFDEY